MSGDSLIINLIRVFGVSKRGFFKKARSRGYRSRSSRKRRFLQSYDAL